MPVRLRAARAEEWSFRSICRFGPGDQEASGKLLPIEAIPTNGRATSGPSAVGMTASHLSQPMLASSRTCQHNATVVGRLKKSAREVAQPERQRMLPTDRLSYSAIGERPQLKLPDGARMAVWVIVNVEEWDPTRPMPRTVLTPPAGGSPMPDVPNWAWHEYGNRVGFWRFIEVFDALSIPAVLAINGSALAAYPPIVRAAVERKWEFIGHGFTQRNMQKVKSERVDIRKVREVLLKATGKAPRGWLGPGPHRNLENA